MLSRVRGNGRIGGLPFAAAFRFLPGWAMAFLSLWIPASAATGEVRTGADRLFEREYYGWIENRRIGLITNPTGVTSNLVPTMELLEADPKIHLAALFAPEHGLFGQEQAGVPIPSGPRLFSLYGAHRAPTPEMLRDIDILLFDIQDVGSRFYTYISTLFECMKAAAQQQIPLIVLDRPNPLNGLGLEGPVLENDQRSFVGIFPMPIRHGLTVGELARYFNAEASLGCDLKIVPLSGWKRSDWFDQTGLEWIFPSPNMPSLATATVYPGSALIEGTNLSEGRGTTRPFELIGAPWLDGRELAGRLNRLNLSGVYFRPQGFIPTFSKYAGENCGGIQIHVLDRGRFEPVTTILHLLAEVLKLHPDHLQIYPRTFDLLAGTASVREGLLAALPVSRLVQQWQPALESFQQRRAPYLLY